MSKNVKTSCKLYITGCLVSDESLENNAFRNLNKKLLIVREVSLS